MGLSTCKDRAELAEMDATAWESQALRMRAALFTIAEFALTSSAVARQPKPASALLGALSDDVTRATDFIGTRLHVLFQLERTAQKKRIPGAAPSAPEDSLRHMMIRKLAEDNTVGSLVTACIACDDVLAHLIPSGSSSIPDGLVALAGTEVGNTPRSSKKRNKKKQQPPASRDAAHPAATSANAVQESLSHLVNILYHFADVPDLAKALARLPQASALLSCIRRNVQWQDALFNRFHNTGKLSYAHAEKFCTITHAMLRKLEWPQVVQLVRDGSAATAVEECMGRDRPNEGSPGATVAFAIRFLVDLATHTVHEECAGNASREEADEVLAAIGALRPFEVAMAALARDGLWQAILPYHAFDFVSYSHVIALLVLPGDSWGRLHSLLSVRQPIKATLRSLAQRSWQYALNMHGNEIGPQIVCEARDALELITQIERGFPCREPYEWLLQVREAQMLNRRYIKPALEARRCSACLKPEVDFETGKRLMECARCGVALYCSKECQKRDWKEGGHKERCMLVK